MNDENKFSVDEILEAERKAKANARRKKRGSSAFCTVRVR